MRWDKVWSGHVDAYLELRCCTWTVVHKSYNTANPGQMTVYLLHKLLCTQVDCVCKTPNMVHVRVYDGLCYVGCVVGRYDNSALK